VKDASESYDETIKTSTACGTSLESRRATVGKETDAQTSGSKHGPQEKEKRKTATTGKGAVWQIWMD